ncbi:putative zinc protease [Halomicronema hongdechloris C2206]|uniref:Zinc protease n=1 Tax=Halomicronema hongdechloris C2206 TaxID=1641165 RepID=A0A1Z3HV63_9CYAN|nr:pitrilysin family protein [Halomicronema hongdechloris]ASC74194.1 putative zinc protease [Halomicronema hongdechloris C2206]
MTSSSVVPTPTLRRTVLDNGLVVLAIENSVADIVSARIFVRVGSCRESAADAGLFSLLMALLTKGTINLSSFDIAEQVESVGASLSSDASTDYSLLSFKTVSSDFADMLALATQLLRQPGFPEPEIDLERRLTLQSIRAMQEQPFTIAFNQLRQAMYGEHPYALPGIGTEASITNLDLTNLKTAHATYFRPDNMVVSIAGNIPPDKAVALVEQAFGDWQPPSQPLPPLAFPTLPRQAKRRLIAQDTQQSIIMVGYAAPAVNHPAYPTLKLLNTYLGNGLSSRLFVELREKRGLAYDVSAFYPTRLGQSQFVAYMGTAPDNTAMAIEGLCQEVERLGTVRLGESELQAAKNKLLGQYALGKQTNAQIAQLLGWYEVLGLGIEFDQQFQAAIRTITADEAQAAAQEFFHHPYLSLLGPAAAIEPFAS